MEENRLTKDIVLAKIPAFPPIVMRVLDLLAREDFEMARLGDLVATDAVFSAQILRAANSPLFGFQARIDSVRHAVVTLGMRRVQALTMTVATSNYMRAALKTEALHRCWRHTVATAILCRELGRACAIPEDRAYTAGLLHDIGRLGILVAYPNEYSAALKEADRDSLALLDLEKKVFGMDHCEAGRCLIEKWGLPPDFCLVTGRHHDPLQTASFDLLEIAHIGCRMADALGYFVVKPLQQCSWSELRDALPAGARHRFPADEEALTAKLEEVLSANDPSGFEVSAPAALPEKPALAQAEPDDFAEPSRESPELPAQARRSLVWDLAVVATTAIVFTLVLAFFVFWNR